MYQSIKTHPEQAVASSNLSAATSTAIILPYLKSGAGAVPAQAVNMILSKPGGASTARCHSGTCRRSRSSGKKQLQFHTWADTHWNGVPCVGHIFIPLHRATCQSCWSRAEQCCSNLTNVMHCYPNRTGQNPACLPKMQEQLPLASRRLQLLENCKGHSQT